MDKKRLKRFEQKAVIRQKLIKALNKNLADLEKRMLKPTKWMFRKKDHSFEEIQQALKDRKRKFLRNDGKSYEYHCDCEWCIENKTFSTIKEKNRMHYEHIEAYDLIDFDDDAII